MQSDIIDSVNKLSIKKKKSENKNSNNYTLIVNNPSVMNIDLVHVVLMGTGQDCEFVNDVLSYRNIVPTSKEFEEIQNIFLKTKLLVTSAKAVINPYIKQSFELKRKFHYENLNPILLYHGTKEKYIDSICTFNFNWRYSGFEKGFKFGKGVNFSDKPIYSTMFCDKNSKGVIIIADVLIKTVSPGNEFLILPPPGADTALGKGTKVFVKFDDNEFCPKYVVHFNKIKTA